MKRFGPLAFAAAFALSTAAAGNALAQPDQHDNGQGYSQNNPAHNGGYNNQHDEHGPQPGYQPEHHQADNNHRWHDGDRYNGHRAVVDWRYHHLRQPPHGYEWVQDGNDYVLIAITSGIIASILLNATNH